MNLFTMTCAALAAAGTAGETIAFEDMTFGQKMGEGAITLVLGMGTVFAVLIFLWVIIAAVGAVIGGTNKPKKKASEPAPAAVPAPAPAPAPVAAPAPAVQTDLSEAELVAVMTAAIAAFGGESSTRIRIRSVRRTTNWNK
ncbi:MAG: OadG family protein [Clostridia bacterium]|nr:OadG family protein [Clostridia bacterium]